MSMELIMKYFFVALFCGISFYIGWVVRDVKYYNDMLDESQKEIERELKFEEVE